MLEVKMQIYLDRIVRAAKLDANLYEEVEADKGAMSQARLCNAWRSNFYHGNKISKTSSEE